MNKQHKHQATNLTVIGDILSQIKIGGIFTILFLLFEFSLFGQFPEVVWQQCYDNSNHDQPVALCETPTGYLVLTQVYNATGTPGFHALYDYHVRFTDTLGNTFFEKCYGGSKSDFPVSVAKTSDNNYLIFGKTNSVDGDIQTDIWGENDFWVLKIDQQGNILFSKTYGGTGDDTPAKLILSDDGGFIFSGTIESGGGDVTEYYGETDMWFCKCDQQGNIAWQKTIGDERVEKCNDFIINAKGNFVIGGYAQNYHNGYPYFDARLMETSISGNILWDSCYNPYQYYDNYEINIVKQLDDQYILLGTKTKIGYDNSKILFIRTDSTGIIEQKNLFGGSWDKCKPSYLSFLGDGGFIIFGKNYLSPCNHSLPSQETSDIWMIKLTYQGYYKWQQCYGGYGEEVLMPNAVIKQGDYKYLIAAGTNSSNSGNVECNTGDNNSDGWLALLQRCPDYEPEIPVMPTGPDTVWSGNNPETTFYIDPPANAWEFNWKLEPDTSGTLTGYGLYAKVEWEPDFTGTASISAQSVNYCGESNWSEPHYIMVYNTIGINEQQAGNINIKVFPNPASTSAAFDYSLPPSETNGIIEITDNFGNIMEKINLTQQKGLYIIETCNYRTGIYYYTLKCGNLQHIGKFIVK